MIKVQDRIQQLSYIKQKLDNGQFEIRDNNFICLDYIVSCKKCPLGGSHYGANNCPSMPNDNGIDIKEHFPEYFI